MADLITGQAFGELFRTFRHSARRLETRDRYRDPEEDEPAGEDIRYLGRDRANALDLPGHDFWLFDQQHLALLWFTADDRLLGAQISTEPAVVRQHTGWLDLAEAHATPYRDYLAADPTQAMPPGDI